MDWPLNGGAPEPTTNSICSLIDLIPQLDTRLPVMSRPLLQMVAAVILAVYLNPTQVKVTKSQKTI
jgi:hypothetical protein